MGALLTTVRDDALLRLGDPDLSIWSNAEITEYLKKGYIDFVARTRLFWVQDHLTATDVADTATVTLPADTFYLERVTWNHGTLIPLKTRELVSRDAEFRTRSGEPQAYALDGDGVLTLRKYPVPSVNGLGDGTGDSDTSLEYFASPASGYTTLDMPEAYIKTVRHFSISMALKKEGAGQDLVLSKHFMDRYEEGVVRATSRRNRAMTERSVSVGSRASRRRRLSECPNVPSTITGYNS